MELIYYLRALLKWWWLIVLATLIAAAISYWNTSRLPRLYRTDTTLMVGRFIQSADPNASDFYTSQQLAQTYVQLVRRQPVLQGAVDALGLDVPWPALAGQVNAWVVPNTQLIQISVVDTSPDQAAALADELAHQMILQSPTTPDSEQAEQRQFINQQINDLRAKIDGARKQVEALDKRLSIETSARAIQDIQGQIGALQQNMTVWQGNYAALLNTYRGSQTNFLSVVDPAVIPSAPFSPNVPYNVLIAALIGGLLAVGGALLLEYLDDTVKTTEDTERIAQLPALGLISHIDDVKTPEDALVTRHSPRSRVAEAYRVLRTNIQFTTLGQPSPRLLVTSAAPGEGKTVTAANLAVIMAQAGLRVILIDTDLRRPSIHKLFGLPNRFGLTNLLLDEVLPLEGMLLPSDVPGLQVLPSGPLPPNPAELLVSKAMRQRLDEAQSQADMVILDSPPVLAVADPAILGASATAIILVVRSSRTRSETLRRGKHVLDRVGLAVAGIVLNSMPQRRGAGGYYQDGAYGYYYSHTDEKKRSSGRAHATNGHTTPALDSTVEVASTSRSKPSRQTDA